MKTLEKLASVKLEPKVLEALEHTDTLHSRFGPMSLQERTMVEMRLEGHSFSKIAAELSEDLKVTRLRWRNMTQRQRVRGWSKCQKPATLNNGPKKSR